MAVFVEKKPKIHAQRPSGPSHSATVFPGTATIALVHPTDAFKPAGANLALPGRRSPAPMEQAG